MTAASDPQARPELCKVVIIGGGMAGLTTAYELSRTPELRSRYQVTLYESSFRLGGKLASGRNLQQACRNEEHGLHVWFGFYENSFRMLEEVLRHWRSPPGCPIRSVWDIVRPHDSGAFGEWRDGKCAKHRLHYPRNLGSPGRSARLAPTLAALSGLLDLARTVPLTLLSLTGNPLYAQLSQTEASSRWWAPGTELGSLADQIQGALDSALSRFLGALRASPRLSRERARRLHRALRALQRQLQPRLARQLLVRNGLRELFFHIDFALALACGLLEPDSALFSDWDLDRINGLDFREWLAQHGAHPDTTRHWSLLEALYDSSFQYLGGDRTRPSFEAGTALRYYLRATFTYKNAVAYLFNFGAGESVIAPLYELLLERGVRIRLLHRLERLELCADRRQVAALNFVSEARLSVPVYEPLFTHRGLRCWGTQPDYAQLESGPQLRAAGVDFEATHWPAHETRVRLEAGADFTEVVLALPLGVLAAPACPCHAWLEAVPRAAQAVRSIALVPSIAAQLWLDRALPGFGRSGGEAMVGSAPPLSIWADMTRVVAREGWAESGCVEPRAAVYLCGAQPASPEPAGDLLARARNELGTLLERHGAELWPSCRSPAGGFDWNALTDPEGRSGRERLQAQFVRVNSSWSELCDVAHVGTSRQRLEADESGVENLTLAGTWLRTSINSSCVEAAVMSGLAAARALGVCDRPIIGEGFCRRTAAELRAAQALDWAAQ